MEVSSVMISLPVPIFPITNKCLSIVPRHSAFNSNIRICTLFHGNHRLTSTRLVSPPPAAINQVSDPAHVQLSWQIVVGALAGVTPFVVAGIEFTKRIVAQKKCGVCRGSGLVLRDNKYYFRCPNCGGFLPWQSWKRFFSG